MTTASGTAPGLRHPPAPGGSSPLRHLVSRTRVLAPGEVDDLLDVLGSDGFAWLRGGAGFVTAGVAARLPVEGSPGRFERPPTSSPGRWRRSPSTARP